MPILIKQIEPWIDQKESVYIKKIIDKKYLTESYETLKFENRIKKRFLSKHAVAVSNWTNGIFMCLKALGIKKDGHRGGQEIVLRTPAFAGDKSEGDQGPSKGGAPV